MQEKIFLYYYQFKILYFTRSHAISVKASELTPFCSEFFNLYALKVFAFSLHFTRVLYIALLQKIYSISVCPSGLNKLFEAR